MSAEIVGSVFADIGVTGDRRREVIGEAFVHRAGCVDRATCIDVPYSELERRVVDFNGFIDAISDAVHATTTSQTQHRFVRRLTRAFILHPRLRFVDAIGSMA